MLHWAASCAVRTAGAMAWTGPPIPITIFVVTNIIICFFNENFPGARLLRLPRLLLISNRRVTMHAGVAGSALMIMCPAAFLQLAYS